MLYARSGTLRMVVNRRLVVLTLWLWLRYRMPPGPTVPVVVPCRWAGRLPGGSAVPLAVLHPSVLENLADNPRGLGTRRFFLFRLSFPVTLRSYRTGFSRYSSQLFQLFSSFVFTVVLCDLSALLLDFRPYFCHISFFVPIIVYPGCRLSRLHK